MNMTFFRTQSHDFSPKILFMNFRPSIVAYIVYTTPFITCGLQRRECETETLALNWKVLLF